MRIRSFPCWQRGIATDLPGVWPQSLTGRTLDCMGMGAELVLLAIDNKRGEIRNSRYVAFAVAAAELIELALTECIALSGGRLTVLSRDGAANAGLTAALTKIADSRQPVTVSAWLGRRGELGRVRDCVLELERAGAVEVDDLSKSVAGEQAMHVRIADPKLAQAAVDRLVAVARGALTGAADEAFAALADAAGLTPAHLRGLSSRRARARISTLTAHHVEPPAEPGRTVLAIARAAVQTMAGTARRAGSGGPIGSMAIPIDKQFVMRQDIQAALRDPNIP